LTPHAATSGARQIETLSPTPLVDLGPRHVREVDHVARAQHGAGERDGLGVVQAAEERGHEPRAHLVVGELAVAVGADQALDLGVVQAPAVALLGDQLDEALHGTGA
jgi:hypothetical protein